MNTILFAFFALCVSFVASQQAYVVTVGSSANANFSTINAALSSVKSGVTWEIQIEAGTYTEQLAIARPNGVMRAISTPVIIQYPGLRNTKDNATVSVNQPNVRMYNITILNMMEEEYGISIALVVFASNVSFYGCSVLGFQDALWFRNSRSIAYFKDCYIEGGVDFIYGSGKGYFDGCTIAVNKRGASITAMQGGSATNVDKFIFNFCKLIPTIPSALLQPYANTSMSYTNADQFFEGNYLGRPWDMFSRVIFMFSEMANHIKPAGWDTWSGRVGYYYREYNNFGPGGVFGPGRVNFTSQLTPEEGLNLTFESLFGSANPSWVDSAYPPTLCPAEGSQCGGSGFTGSQCCRFPYSCVSDASVADYPTCQYVPSPSA